LGTAFLFISRIGDWSAVWLAICIAVLWVGRGDEKSHRVVVLTLVALLVTEAIVGALKVIVARPRPADLLPQVETLRIAVGGFSFPSAHAARAFAAASVLGSYFAGGRWTLWIVAALIAVSRVALGVHYPLDVIVGALLGAGVGWLLLRVGAAWDWRRGGGRIEETQDVPRDR